MQFFHSSRGCLVDSKSTQDCITSNCTGNVPPKCLNCPRAICPSMCMPIKSPTTLNMTRAPRRSRKFPASNNYRPPPMHASLPAPSALPVQAARSEGEWGRPCQRSSFAIARIPQSTSTRKGERFASSTAVCNNFNLDRVCRRQQIVEVSAQPE